MMAAPVMIYFDGLCPLCSREIALLQRRADPQRVEFIDIAAADFDAAQHGLDPLAVHRQMHVRVDGQLYVGLDALIAMWDQVPGFRWLAAFHRFPLIYPLAKLGYRLFAWIRPKLPRRRSAVCSTRACDRSNR